MFLFLLFISLIFRTSSFYRNRFSLAAAHKTECAYFGLSSCFASLWHLTQIPTQKPIHVKHFFSLVFRAAVYVLLLLIFSSNHAVAAANC